MRSLLLFAVLGLSACSSLPGWAGFSAFRPSWPLAHSDHFNFDWALSGDREVAPLQVFDNGRQIWLQFPPGHALPAVFARTPEGDQPLPFRQQGPYVLLDGMWPHLVLRGGQLMAHATRGGPVSAMETDVLIAVQAAEPVPVQAPAPETVPPPQVLGPAYEAGPADHNMRLALARWAQLAGWTFDPSHWALDVDIPISASARFEGEFKNAVRELLAATELGDRPAQPCFYSNKVLRIVAYAELCDRTQPPAAAS